MAYYYDSASVQVNWNGLNLSEGWGEDTFISITRNNPIIEASGSSSGERTYSKIADKSATITMTFKDVAPINLKIAEVAALQDVIGSDLQIAPFTVYDPTGDTTHFVTLNAVLTEVPEVSLGRVSGEKTWTWDCEYCIHTNDPTSVTSALDQFIKQSTNIAAS